MQTTRLLWLLPLLILAACSNSDVRDTLGINKAAPDEFVVVSRPPLSLPPEFDLRPPRPGEAPRVPSAEDQARKALLGADSTVTTTPETAVSSVTSGEAPSSAASNFLRRAGADAADNAIRDKLSVDVVTPIENKKADSLYEEIVGSKKEDPVVDPKKETERLIENKKAGKPVTEGEVPVQEKKPSVIDTIF